MAGNTRFDINNGLIVNAETGVNSEFFCDLNGHSNLVINAAAKIIGNTQLANLTVGATTLFVDTVHGNVCIGTATANSGAALTVAGNANVSGNVSITGGLLFVGGNFTVTGNLVYSNTQTSGLLPASDQNPLGNTTDRFNGFFFDVIVYDKLLPSANGIALGNTTSRWAVFANNGNYTGDLSVNATAFYVNSSVNRVSVNSAVVTSDALYIVGTANVQGNIVANGTLTANVFSTGGAVWASNTASVTVNTQVIVDQFAVTETQCVKYIVFAKNSSFIEALEILLIQDTVSIVIQTSYGDVFNTKLGAMDAAIVGSNVQIYFTVNSAIGATPGSPVTVKTQKFHF